MTIDEAISHALEVAERYERMEHSHDDKLKEECLQCAADHRQLAEWLRELKELREENKVLISECDRLIKEKGELLSKVSGGDVLRICQLEEQLEKAKRLLKSATNVLNMYIPCDEDYCSECIKQRQNCDYDDSFKWLYADEALTLIGEDGEQK